MVGLHGALAVLILTAYLIVTPFVVAQVEQNFQQKMAYARSPETYWTGAAAAIQRVRSDAKTMHELRWLAKAEAAQPAPNGKN